MEFTSSSKEVKSTERKNIDSDKSLIETTCPEWGNPRREKEGSRKAHAVKDEKW